MPDARKLSSLSGDLASYVLETCIKLQNPDDFHAAMNEVCTDIRELCGSEHCCILLMDTANRSCSVLCEDSEDFDKRGRVADKLKKNM